MNSRIPIFGLLMLCAVAFGQQDPQKPSQPSAPGTAPVLVLQGMGQGIAPVDGDWQFHLGDDPAWAQPSVNDSEWETIGVDGPWGVHGHPSYSGFAWYRRHLQIIPAMDKGRSTVPSKLMFSKVEHPARWLSASPAH